MSSAVIAITIYIFSSATAAQDTAARQELLPTGKLRVAIAVGVEPSALYALKDGETYRGVTVDLAKGLAAKLDVPVTFVVYNSSPGILADADANKWDVTFLPVDENRKNLVAFGPPYHLLQSTFLVSPSSKIYKLEDVGTGVRVAGIENTATFRAAKAWAKDAIFLNVPTPEAAFALLQEGKADAIAFSRESLRGFAAKIPNSRILDGGFLNSTTAVAVPKGKSAALAYVTAYVEEAKASGTVQRAFESIGLKNSIVAPVGMKP